MSVCQRCGAEFSCGMVDDKSDAPCWCTQLPPLPSSIPGTMRDASCYCPNCLKTLTTPTADADKTA